jgi:hypothetical protein
MITGGGIFAYGITNVQYTPISTLSLQFCREPNVTV